MSVVLPLHGPVCLHRTVLLLPDVQAHFAEANGSAVRFEETLANLVSRPSS